MKNSQENLKTLTIWSHNVTISTREPTIRAWISADIWRQDSAICSKNKKKMSHITGVSGSQDLRSPSPIMTNKRNYSQHSLSIHSRARKRERSKRGVGWMRGGEGALRAKQAGIRHWTQSWSAVLMGMTLSSLLNQWDFSVSGVTGNSLSSKDVYSSSILLGPHPLPGQVFRFALAPSSLAIMSASSTTE